MPESEAEDPTREATPRPGPETFREGETGPWAASAGFASPPATPTRIGRFEIRAILGEGAFGRVYRGFDPELEREVAIKVPHPDGLTPSFRARFVREARATAQIHHPNVCPIYKVDTDGDLPYLVMHLVAGPTLSVLLDRLRSPLPVRNALTIARKLALGVAAAHAQGVIHRDLKPQNILYDRALREVLITDFGLARIGTETRMTADGAVLGTPAYMSPEQARGKVDEVGPLSDVYSLGVILYRLLTGEAPFRGTPFEIMIQHSETPPRPPSTVRSGLDPRLDSLCLKAMAKKPEDRYPSAKEFAKALGAYLRAAEQGIETGAVQETFDLDTNEAGSPGLGKLPLADGPKSSQAGPPPLPRPDSAKSPKPVPPPLPVASPRPVPVAPKPAPRPVPPSPARAKPAPPTPKPPSRPAVRREPVKQKSRKTVVLVTAVLLLAGVAVGLLLWKKPWEEQPNGQVDTTNGEKGGPDTPPVTPPITPPITPPVTPSKIDPRKFPDHKFDQAAERRTAEWALRVKNESGGLTLEISEPDGVPHEVDNPVQLTGTFVVRRLTFSFDVFVDDELRANLAGLSGPLGLQFGDGVQLTDKTVSGMGKIPKLEWLSITNAPKVTDACLSEISRHPALQILELVDTGVTSAELVKVIHEFFALKSLSVDESLATNELLSSLKELPTLEQLHLIREGLLREARHDSLLTKSGFASLSALKNLKILNLSGHPVEDDWLPTLHALPLQTVILTKTNVTQSGLRELQKKLPKCAITPTPLAPLAPPKD